MHTTREFESGPQITRRSPPNSKRNWRQIPQGQEGPPVPGAATASETKVRCPSVTAFNAAVLSAQIVAPNDEFSTLAPV